MKGKTWVVPSNELLLDRFSIEYLSTLLRDRKGLRFLSFDLRVYLLSHTLLVKGDKREESLQTRASFPFESIPNPQIRLQPIKELHCRELT